MVVYRSLEVFLTHLYNASADNVRVYIARKVYGENFVYCSEYKFHSSTIVLSKH